MRQALYVGIFGALTRLRERTIGWSLFDRLRIYVYRMRLALLFVKQMRPSSTNRVKLVIPAGVPYRQANECY
jgi:hypothetical protein